LKTGQRLGRSPAAVLGEHQVRPGLLAQRVLLDEVGELTDQRGVPAAVQVGGHPGVQSGQPFLGQPGHLGVDRGRCRHVGERRPAPQVKGAAEQLGGVLGVVGAAGRVAPLGEQVEVPQVGVLVGGRAGSRARPW